MKKIFEPFFSPETIQAKKFQEVLLNLISNNSLVICSQEQFLKLLLEECKTEEQEEAVAAELNDFMTAFIKELLNSHLPTLSVLNPNWRNKIIMLANEILFNQSENKEIKHNPKWQILIDEMLYLKNTEEDSIYTPSYIIEKLNQFLLTIIMVTIMHHNSIPIERLNKRKRKKRGSKNISGKKAISNETTLSKTIKRQELLKTAFRGRYPFLYSNESRKKIKETLN